VSELYHPGHALPPDAPAPRTPYGIAHRGGEVHPTLAAMQAVFPDAVVRAEVCWGDTIVFVTPTRIADVLRWMRDDPAQRYEYLVDITAVEYREAGRPLDVVWMVRSLAWRRVLRLKVELDASAPMAVPSIVDIWRSADWLERECYDMFGITFTGHPDLRRILMWESYAEGHPLRKDFPLRGRFSRAEQLSQALRANPEAHYSMNELSIADAYGDIPADMRARLDAGEVVGE
jgi:NADH-quinone oxidoreductase subunit C